jgi:Asp-tRNA(Asn)/Glu-tRNA(Gln) amidotransferase A subunit family amidase
VPAGFAGPRNALPIGISFMGTRRDDADVLDLAAAFEAGTQAPRADVPDHHGERRELASSFVGGLMIS